MEDYLFYDIEVFKEDSLVVFKNFKKETVKIFHNNFDGILELITDKILVGYNNYGYDDVILTAMIEHWTPYQIKQLNDRIIGGERVKKVHPSIQSLDCFQQIDVAKPSLKKIEGNFGKSIIESKIDFTIDRKLTPEELKETIDYCSYDVDTTIDVFKLRQKDYFEPKQLVIDMLPDKQQSYAKKWNTTTISANVLAPKPMPKWSDIRLGDYDKNGNYELLDIPPQGAVDLWLTKDKGKYTHKEFGCDLEFSFGGLHGVPSSDQKRFESVLLLDVASLYPNIILKLNALGQSTNTYQQIVERRLSVKHTDKQLSGALKLVINSCYGLLNNEYSTLYNPKAAKSVCMYGQICLYDLCQRLAPTCKLVNINTDGVAFTTQSDYYKTIWHEWEEDYGFTLELDSFDLFVQKDVNNYIGLKNGEIKVKGGDVGRFKKDTWFKNNNLRIVDIAIVNKLVYGKDILETVMENLNQPKLFQMILQAGGTYQGTFDANGNKYNKINRVFPIKQGGVLLYKKRKDNGLVRFPDTPDHMLVWNDDVDKITDFRKRIDINFYYSLIQKVLERWI
nr:DNA polymerase domain-containing protein [Melissococcus plutonius]